MNSNFFFLVLLCLISCSKQEKEFERDFLAAIIADMHIAEVALEGHLANERDSLANLYLQKIEIIHGVSRDQMKYQVELLMEDPLRQSLVYDKVIEIIRNGEKEVKKRSDDNQNLNK